MKVFISWSGARSKHIALALRDFVKDCVQATQPFVSASDINAGSRWAGELTTQLSQTNVGILCLTPENLKAPWLLFEAGALSKAIDHSAVCPYLHEVANTDLEWPLAQFQANGAAEDGTRKIIELINERTADRRLGDGELARAFSRCWPELKTKLSSVPPLEDAPESRRPLEDLVEETLSLVRALTIQHIPHARGKHIVFEFSGGPLDGHLTAARLGEQPSDLFNAIGFWWISKEGQMGARFMTVTPEGHAALIAATAGGGRPNFTDDELRQYKAKYEVFERKERNDVVVVRVRFVDESTSVAAADKVNHG